MQIKEDDLLRKELTRLLSPGGAHAGFDKAVAQIPKKYYAAPVEGIPYTLWGILEHMRRAQRDILDYMINPDYVEPVWPDDYWPKAHPPPSEASWKNCIRHFRQDLQELIDLVNNPQTNILRPIPHLEGGPIILREILLVADHNAYHIGQIILLRRFLGIWKDR